MLLKETKLDHFSEKTEEQKNQTIDQLVSFQMFPKIIKDGCMINLFLY